MEKNNLEINSKIENYHKINNYQNRKNILYENYPICTRIGERNEKKEKKKYKKNILFYHGDQQQVMKNQHFMNTHTTSAPIIFNSHDNSYMLKNTKNNNLKEGDLREIANSRINYLSSLSQEINIKEKNSQIPDSNPFLKERGISSDYEKINNNNGRGFRMNMGRSNFPINNSIQFQTHYGINTRERKIKIKEEKNPRSLPSTNNNLYVERGYSNPIPIERGMSTNGSCKK